MKNYKNIFRILIGTVCFQLSMTGCSDDFLTPDPLSLYEPSITFNTVEGLNAALASADKALRAYWTNTEACDLMLPLMSEYLFSDLTVAAKTDDALIFCDINERFTPNNMVGIILTKTVWLSFGEKPIMVLNMLIRLSVILIKWKDWTNQ